MSPNRLVVVVLLAAACSSRAEYPITEQALSLSRDLNEKMTGVAPDVASALTAARIARAQTEPHNWLTYYGNYYGQRYSGLDQINTTNVKDLKVAWVFQYGNVGLTATPATYAYESAPIVVDGVMYVTGYDGLIWALDAATGAQLWQHHHATPLDVPLCCGNVNRGAAVAQGKVFYATPHAHLVALDARTGAIVWEQTFADIRAGETATVAPLVVKNLVIVGASGAEYGVRGHLDAFDINTGRQVWRRYTIPKPGEPGSETWPANSDAWSRGGGTTWITGSYDPELDLLYWNTGNAGPDFDGSVRPGANLFSNSVLALDPDDGSIRWHYQWTPHDLWDYDGNNENILFDDNGRRLLAHFDKNGHLFILDRTNGRLQRVVPFARVTWADIHATNGTITVRQTPTPQGVTICPGPAGGKEWNHGAYSPRTRLLYTPIVEQCAVFKSGSTEFKEGMPYWGGSANPDPENNAGGVKAFNANGDLRWQWQGPHPIVSSLVATAGDLVFFGEPTGAFHALDARSGEMLWHFQTGSGIHSNPISYSVNGKQYVAVWSGWGGWIKGFAPKFYGAPRGDALFVFALP